MLWDIELANSSGQGYEDRMSRVACVTRVQFALPLVEQFERSGWIADLIAKIIRDAAIRIHIAEMLAESSRQKPGGNREIFVMRARQAAAIGLRVDKRGSYFGIAYSGGRLAQPTAGMAGIRGWSWWS